MWGAVVMWVSAVVMWECSGNVGCSGDMGQCSGDVGV